MHREGSFHRTPLSVFLLSSFGFFLDFGFWILVFPSLQTTRGRPTTERPRNTYPNFTVATKIAFGTFSTGRNVSPATCFTVTGSLMTCP